MTRSRVVKDDVGVIANYMLEEYEGEHRDAARVSRQIAKEIYLSEHAYKFEEDGIMLAFYAYSFNTKGEPLLISFFAAPSIRHSKKVFELTNDMLDSLSHFDTVRYVAIYPNMHLPYRLGSNGKIYLKRIRDWMKYGRG